MDKMLIYTFNWEYKCRFNKPSYFGLLRPLESTCPQAATLPCLTGSGACGAALNSFVLPTHRVDVGHAPIQGQCPYG